MCSTVPGRWLCWWPQSRTIGCNTAATATIIGLTEDKPIFKVWTDIYLWSFPYYMVGAATAGLVHFLNAHIGWQSSLLVLPPIYLMYRSYRLYLGKLETEKQHAEQVSHLHLRTIEALALAIEAKDRDYRRALAARPHLRDGTGERTGLDRGRDRGAAGRVGAA